MKSYFARITDVNDSMHCYGENDIVEIIAEFKEDGQMFYIAQQTGTDYQQKITADEFEKFRPSFKKQYIGKKGDICANEQTASPCLVHLIEPFSEVEILSTESDWRVRVYSAEQDLTQTVDIRDINFNI